MDYSTEALLIAVLFAVISNYTNADRGRLYMLSSPNSMAMPINDESILTCEMNINADQFQWLYYPLPAGQASNPKAAINLGSARFRQLNDKMYKNDRKSTKLFIKSSNNSVAGDYQCLAFYGASVVASIPGRISITNLENFPRQDNVSITVTAGNTVMWRCEPPVSNPPAYIDYTKDSNYFPPNMNVPKTQSLVLSNVSATDSGVYKCSANNNIENRRLDSDFSFKLKVVSNGPARLPSFIIPPRKVYTVEKGSEVFLECSAIGTPVPKVIWFKNNGELPRNRIEMFPGGLRIFSVTAEDDGVYICNHTNAAGTISHHITLIYNEAPNITEGPASTNMSEGESLDLECHVKGTPKPAISWFLNGRSVINDSAIEAVGNQIFFRPLQKRHAGFLQCFASNLVGTKYSSAELRVIPKQISSTDVMEDFSTHQPAHKRRKHKNKKRKGSKGSAQMIPPSKPTVSRLNDESVVVRWTVPVNAGLPIQFFKVQYQELGPFNQNNTITRMSKWKTCNQDIAPNIRSYEVNNLKPEHVYKFRIAAVYSNNDNKLSPKSEKFHLNRTDFFTRNPLPVPKLTHTETINATSIRIFWECMPSDNSTVDGFFISYMSASSAGDYMKATVDGEGINTYVITHLQPDTVYDIKMQSFTTKSASEFSPILKQKTTNLTVETPTTKSITPESETAENPQLYVIIGGVIGVAVILSAIISLIVCRKWKKGKDNTRGDRNMEDINHHFQSEGNDYVVNPKSLGRPNGCGPPSRITITSNPLADADNKNQNVIEMSCLSSQNNNCATTQPSASSNRETSSDSLTKKGKIKGNRSHEPSENYV